jgi:hypothetical protein
VVAAIFAVARIPVTPVVRGRPVALVRTTDVGVPRSGVTRVGEVEKTRTPVPVSSVMAAKRFALDGVASTVAMPVPNPLTPVLIGKPVAFVNVTDVGVPRSGVTRVGEVEKTAAPVPVSSLKIPSSCAEVVAANTLRLLAVTTNVESTSGKVNVLVVNVVMLPA